MTSKQFGCECGKLKHGGYVKYNKLFFTNVIGKFSVEKDSLGLLCLVCAVCGKAAKG